MRHLLQMPEIITMFNKLEIIKQMDIVQVQLFSSKYPVILFTKENYKFVIIIELQQLS